MVGFEVKIPASADEGPYFACQTLFLTTKPFKIDLLNSFDPICWFFDSPIFHHLPPLFPSKPPVFPAESWTDAHLAMAALDGRPNCDRPEDAKGDQ